MLIRQRGSRVCVDPVRRWGHFRAAVWWQAAAPIPWIQFAQTRCHLPENKWEAEGRMGWKDKRQACGSTVRLSQKGGEKTVRDEGADGQTEECHGWGKVPPVIERRHSGWQCKRACDKSNCLPAGWGGQLFIQRAAIETARRSRRRKRGWREVGKEGEMAWRETEAQRDQVKRERVQRDSAFRVKVRKTVGSPLTDVFFSLLMNDSWADREEIFRRLWAV